MVDGAIGVVVSALFFTSEAALVAGVLASPVVPLIALLLCPSGEGVFATAIDVV